MTSTISEAVLFLSRWLAVSILFKATVMLALGLTFAWLAGRSRAALRHIVLAATFGTLVILPLIVASGHALVVEVPIAARTEPAAAVTTTPASPNATPATLSNAGPLGAEVELSSVSWPTAASFIWIAGALTFLLPLAINLWWLRGLRRNGLPSQSRPAGLLPRNSTVLLLLIR
jgi:hypothetical protein